MANDEIASRELLEKGFDTTFLRDLTAQWSQADDRLRRPATTSEGNCRDGAGVRRIQCCVQVGADIG